MPEISIIMPVFNTEKYVGRAIESVLAQSFTDFELLCVDNASSDGSGAVCARYASRDDRIRLLRCETPGVSHARNTGIENARGNYIGFVDSDDYIDADMYEFLYRNIKDYNADMSICGLYSCFQDRTEKPGEHVKKLLPTKEAVREFLIGRYFGASQSTKLYRKALFNNCRYPLGRTTEDGYVMLELLLQAGRIILDNAPKYYYVHRADSITTSKPDNSVMDVVISYRHNFTLVQDNFPDLLDEARFRLYWAYFTALSRIVAAPGFEKGEAYWEIVRYIRKHWMDIVRNPYVAAKRKLMTVILWANDGLYAQIMRHRIQKDRLF